MWIRRKSVKSTFRLIQESYGKPERNQGFLSGTGWGSHELTLRLGSAIARNYCQ
jgi:hypothetical protein